MIFGTKLDYLDLFILGLNANCCLYFIKEWPSTKNVCLPLVIYSGILEQICIPFINLTAAMAMLTSILSSSRE